MATNPAPGACLKCNTPMVAGAGFCGTCGTPAGSPGRPPMPPPMPPRPLSHGSRQVVVPMDQQQAMHSVMNVLPRVNGEVTNFSPVQLAFRIGNFFSGRHTGTIDTFPEGPQRTAVNVQLKTDYSSLVPTVGAVFVLLLILSVVAGLEAYKVLTTPGTVVTGPGGTMQYQATQPSFLTFFQWYVNIFILAVIAGIRAWVLAGPQLENRKMQVQQALQMLGGMPPGMPGTPHQAFGPQAGPLGAGIPGQGTPPQATPFEQLRKLAELRDSGAISVDDFEKAKADIMKKIA